MLLLRQTTQIPIATLVFWMGTRVMLGENSFIMGFGVTTREQTW